MTDFLDPTLIGGAVAVLVLLVVLKKVGGGKADDSEFKTELDPVTVPSWVSTRIMAVMISGSTP